MTLIAGSNGIDRVIFSRQISVKIYYKMTVCLFFSVGQRVDFS